jgi:hypothetical protein
MRDEGAIDWWEGFPTSIGQGSKLKEGYQGGRGVSCVLRKSKGEEWKCEKEI